jgi:hypothetical protein
VNPFRLDVLALALLLGVPVIGLGLDGDVSVDQLAWKALACLGAATVALWLLRTVGTPVPSGQEDKDPPFS